MLYMCIQIFYIFMQHKHLLLNIKYKFNAIKILLAESGYF